MKTLKGITWNHSRAFPPLVAVSQRYEEINPNIRIIWEKRTLDEFGHKPINQLISEYDLIVIDHPWAEFCFDQNLVVDLKNHLSKGNYSYLKNNCIGSSFQSYEFQDKLLAIPIDAATPVPSWRPDLMKLNNLTIPKEWQEIVELADEGHAIMPGFGADLFLNWLMLLHSLEARPFAQIDAIAEKNQGIEAMSLLKRLAEKMPREIWNWNPIDIAEIMTTSDDYAYCCFAYSYGNYCRHSFTDKILQYGNLAKLNNKRLRSILGGTGIAISANCKDISLAVDYALYCSHPDIQSGIYSYAGGQAVNKQTWSNSELKSFTNGFFSDCSISHEEAIVRPRYSGYVPLQENAGGVLQQFMIGEISANKAWEKIHNYYQMSRSHNIINTTI